LPRPLADRHRSRHPFRPDRPPAPHPPGRMAGSGWGRHDQLGCSRFNRGIGHMAAAARRPFWRTLYFQVLVGIALGVLTGWAFPDAGRSLKPLGDGFIKLVKMIITPAIFLSVVTGIAQMPDLKAVDRVGATS